MKLNQAFIQRRFVEVRQGHSTYIGYALTIVNTIVLLYGFHLASIFPNIWVFGIVAFLLYLPITIGLGHWHRKSQYRVDNAIYFEGNPQQAAYYRLVLELLEGKAKPEDIQNMKARLRAIEQVS